MPSCVVTRSWSSSTPISKSAPSPPASTRSSTSIRQAGGTVDKVDIWGRRRLAYEINKKAEGIYAVLDMTCTPDAVEELDRQL